MKGKHKKSPDSKEVVKRLAILAVVLDVIDKLLSIISKLLNIK
ncbi:MULTISPECIES: hypothetical protein [Companilactobacillus]